MTVKEDILKTIEQLDVLQKQSLNRFDTPEIYERVFEYLDLLDANMHKFNDQHPDPDQETNRLLQDLFFHIKKMRETTIDLKEDPAKLQSQDDFISSIDRLKEDLAKLD